MFSFFKRTRKDQESNGIKDKDKKSKEKNSTKDDNASPTSVPKDMCKNKLTQKSESALQSGNINVTPNIVPESRLRENGIETVRATSSDEVTAKNEKKVTVTNETIEPNLPKTSNTASFSETTKKSMEVSQNGPVKHSPSPVTSYASAVKNEIQQRRNSVKPCGHGTVAIAPRIPSPSNKRDMGSDTPPSSPDLNLGAKPKYRRVHSYEHSPPDKQHNLDKLKNGRAPHIDDPISDTVRAAIKLKVDLPLSKPPINKNSPNKTLNTGSKHVLVNGIEDDAAKYVIN